eukprot:SM000137S00436  [mRNA]  locus=s137:117302:119054:+ [translate_table: standard]
MATFFTFLRYLRLRAEASVHLTRAMMKSHDHKPSYSQTLTKMYDNFRNHPLTFMESIKGDEMAPTFTGKQGETLLLRWLPQLFPRVNVGDVVCILNPVDDATKLVRRVAALEGDEMVSSKEQDEAFDIPVGHCWLLCDNELKKPPEVVDSRVFGPVQLNRVIGRVIYCSRSLVDHAQVVNSPESMEEDAPVLACELNIEDMNKTSS